MKDFTGRVAVITGAGSGIGQALALNLASCGARLALSDVDEQRVDETVERCRHAGAAAVGYRLDVADRDAVVAHAERVALEFGGVDLVVNNAGVALFGTVADTSWEQLDWIIGINFWGVLHGSRAFLPYLRESGGGHLVNLSSVFGLIGVPTQSAYNAAKFGVRGFTEALAQEMRAEDAPVRVSCVHPGGIRTNIARDARGLQGAEHERAVGVFDRIARTSPQGAAETIVRGVERERSRILIGPDAYVIDLLPRVLASGYQRLVTLAAKRGLL